MLAHGIKFYTCAAPGTGEMSRPEMCMEKAEHLLSENHSLVAVIKQCLDNNPALRPRTGELLTRQQEMLTPGELRCVQCVCVLQSWSCCLFLIDCSVCTSLHEHMYTCTHVQVVMTEALKRPAKPRDLLTASPALQQIHTHRTRGEGQGRQTQKKRVPVWVWLHSDEHNCVHNV